MSEANIHNIYNKINPDNYLVNCYKHLTRIKLIHFIFILIEMLLNTLQELEIFLKNFNSQEIKVQINYISNITNLFNKLEIVVKLIIIILIVIIFDTIFFLLKKKRLKKEYIIITILVNILELFYFRTFTLILLNLFFTLPDIYFPISCLFLFPHIYIIINHFLYNHLYYFVPKFIEYPYDEFSSLFDIVLLFIKIFLSASMSTSDSGFEKFCSLIFYFIQIWFCIYFIIKLKNHSYLFMKNSFLNKTKFCFFLIKTIIIIFSLILGRNEIMNILFLILSIVTIFIIMTYIYLIYNPLHYIKIKREAPLENIFFYLFILSDTDKIDFLFEIKIKEHYEKCGICNLCKKYFKYLNSNQKKIEKEEDEKKSFIREEKINNNIKLINLFDIIYNGENKYFQLIKKITLNYKKKGKETFNNNSYYYINLSFLIYSDYKKNNITLSLNEKIILEEFNKENKLLDNHKFQINQILYCNKFISLGNKILNKLKDILKSEQNLSKAQQLIDLSILLNKMKKPIYKKNLLNHKQEHSSNSKNLITSCSILYEEIFNIAINSSQIPIRDNILYLEDIYHNNTNKSDNIISLSLDLTNKNCKIIRTGKDLYPFKNKNLFDLFPLIFKEYQTNLFLKNILTNFDIYKENRQGSNYIENKNTNNIKAIKYLHFNNNINKKEIVEMDVIICQNISKKIFYKLLTIKLYPLFNNDYNSYFIIFDGNYFLHNNTLLTLQHLEENIYSKEKLISVSEPELENSSSIYSMSFEKYIKWLNNNGYNLTKIMNFNLSSKLYCIYKIIQKKRRIKRKFERKISLTKDKNKYEDQEENKSLEKKMKIEQIIEDNASVAASQQTGSGFSNGISGIGIRNKKKENIYEYGNLNNIKKMIYISLPIIFLGPIIQFFILRSELNDTTKNNYNYLEFREIFQLYFEIFTSILGITCIKTESDCESLASIYSSQHNSGDDYFNYSLLIRAQSQVLSQKMMNKRSNLNNIHRNIGTYEYNQIFGQNVKYIRLTQIFINNNIYYNLTYVNISFSEAILTICNSFHILTNNTTNDPIYFLNKIEEPFSLLYEKKKDGKELSDYQKELYEMILNYKIYRQQLNLINNKLNEILESKTEIIRSYLYIFIHLDSFLILFFISLLYIYLLYFENILVKILNYVNMTINIKTDNFNFYTSFSQKIENLEIILEIYNGDPVKAVQNLNNIYNSYQQYQTSKNKSNLKEMNKKTYKKNGNLENKKNEMDNIPKNQRIVNRRDIRKLNLFSNYLLIIILIFILLICSYIILMIIWKKYFFINANLYSLIKKNLSVEASLYKSMNFYYLMIFQNYTIDELSPKVFFQYKEGDNDRNSILRSFYKDVQNAFNSQKEKNNLKNFYFDFEDTAFTCEILFEMNKDNLEALKKNYETKNLKDIKGNLINLCKYTKLIETNDIITAFQRHYQYIKNGILSITDFSYDGLIHHLYNGFLGRNTIYFNCILIYVLEVNNNQPHKNGIDNLLKILRRNFKITEVIFIGIDVILFIISLFYYISNIKNYISQFFLLKNIFKIFEIQEQ